MILDMGNYAINLKLLVSVEKGRHEIDDKLLPTIQLRLAYSNDLLKRVYTNDEKRDNDYRKIVEAWSRINK